VKTSRRVVAVVAAVTAVFTFAAANLANAAGWTKSPTGNATSKADTLGAPGTGSTSGATSSSLVLSWSAPSGLAPSGYVVSRSTTTGGPYTAVGSGTCSGTIATTSCTDTGLSGSTQYFYVVKAVIGTNWVGSQNTQFTGTTTSATLTATSLSINNGPNTQGKPDQGDTIVIVFSQAISTTSVCSTWSTGTLTGLTVTMNKGNQTNNLSVAGCTGMNFGTLVTTASGYNTANGSNAGWTSSTMTWNSSTLTLTVTLGTYNNSGTLAQDLTNHKYTYTPDTGITNAGGGTHASGSVDSATTILF